MGRIGTLSFIALAMVAAAYPHTSAAAGAPTMASATAANATQNVATSASHSATNQVLSPSAYTPYEVSAPSVTTAPNGSFGTFTPYTAMLSGFGALPYAGPPGFRADPAVTGFAVPNATRPAMIFQFSKSNSADYFEFDDGSQHVKKLNKAVVYTAMVAIMTAIASRSQLAVASTTGTANLVNLATANAKDLCGQVDYSGTDVSASIKNAADAKLPLMLAKVGVKVDASANFQASGNHYEGPTRNDLPAVISSELQCRTDAERYLLDAMKEEIHASNQPTSSTNVSVKTGNVYQEQSQQVNVNNTPVEIPGFTIREQSFDSGMGSTFEVTPHPANDSNSQVPGRLAMNSRPEPSLHCNDAGQIKPGTTATFDLIVNLPRCIHVGAAIVFLGEVNENGHKRAVFQSADLWSATNNVSMFDGAPAELHAIAVVEKGKAIYITPLSAVWQVEYNFSADEAITPADGSDMHITITVSNPSSTN